jgi:putative SOS response-associated peptidase YedK
MDIPVLPMPRINNATPGTSLVVLTGPDTITCMQWGLIPAYQEMGEKLDFYKMFNARSETMLTSPVFGRCLKQGRRCVAVVSGYFEWKQELKDKQPYYIYPDEAQAHAPMFLAAVFDEWNDTQTFAILTRTAVPPLDQVHPRQPVFLASAFEADLWISRGDLPGLSATPAVAWHPVDSRMGNPKNQEEWVTKRVSVPKISSFFSKVDPDQTHRLGSPVRQMMKRLREDTDAASTAAIALPGYKKGKGTTALASWLARSPQVGTALIAATAATTTAATAATAATAIAATAAAQTPAAELDPDFQFALELQRRLDRGENV